MWDGRERECDICWEPFLPTHEEQDVCPACEALFNVVIEEEDDFFGEEE